MIQNFSYLVYLFSHLNSPNYHSVYPPFLQSIFKFSVKLGDNKLDREIFILKVFYAVFSIATVFLLPYLLKLYGVNAWHAVIYVLNPLVILEEMGNLHAEGIMVFFLALFLVALKKQPKLAFLPFSTAIAVKLTPLLLIPAILRRLSLKHGVFFSLGIFLTLALFFLPYANGIIKGGFFESLSLYFNKLEFNAFGYNIFKAFGFLTHGYNKIKTLGPLTAILSTGLILYFSGLNALLFAAFIFLIAILYTTVFKKMTKYIVGFKSYVAALFYALMVILLIIYYSVPLSAAVILMFMFYYRLPQLTL
jgi:hypothetical protein